MYLEDARAKVLRLHQDIQNMANFRAFDNGMTVIALIALEDQTCNIRQC